jgi:hypothetical protein
MTTDELRTELHKKREQTISMLRQLSTAPPELLKAFGYGGKTNAEAVLASFLRQDAELEKMIVAWEKANPR